MSPFELQPLLKFHGTFMTKKRKAHFFSYSCKQKKKEKAREDNKKRGGNEKVEGWHTFSGTDGSKNVQESTHPIEIFYLLCVM